MGEKRLLFLQKNSVCWHSFPQELELRPSPFDCGLDPMTCFQRVWKRRNSNFPVEKIGKHYLTQVIKFNITNNVVKMSCTLWCVVIRTTSPLWLCFPTLSWFFPKREASLTWEKHQTNLNWGAVYKMWPLILKTSKSWKISKDWEAVTEQRKARCMWWPELDLQTEKHINGIIGEIQIKFRVQLIKQCCFLSFHTWPWDNWNCLRGIQELSVHFVTFL